MGGADVSRRCITAPNQSEIKALASRSTQVSFKEVK
jgi:hypothetical protein